MTRFLTTTSIPALVTGQWPRVHYLRCGPGVHEIAGYDRDGVLAATEHVTPGADGVAWTRGSYASVVYGGRVQ